MRPAVQRLVVQVGGLPNDFVINTTLQVCEILQIRNDYMKQSPHVLAAAGNTKKHLEIYMCRIAFCARISVKYYELVHFHWL